MASSSAARTIGGTWHITRTWDEIPRGDELLKMLGYFTNDRSEAITQKELVNRVMIAKQMDTNDKAQVRQTTGRVGQFETMAVKSHLDTVVGAVMASWYLKDRHILAVRHIYERVGSLTKSGIDEIKEKYEQNRKSPH